MKKIEKSIELGGRKLTLSCGVLARQASGAVMARYGDTVVLATVVRSSKDTLLDYFPLFVEYQERLYAGGKIKGSRWVKREGRPSDEEILAGRLIDRSIRPLFPTSYKKEVQVMVIVLSVDMENSPVILGSIAASAAIAISPIPWGGPTSTLRVGYKDGAYFANPLTSEQNYSDMDLVISNNRDAVLMVEAGAREVSEEQILGGVKFAQSESKKVLDLIDDLAKEVGVKKEAIPADPWDKAMVGKIKKLVDERIPSVIASMADQEGGKSSEYDDLVLAAADFAPDGQKQYVATIVDKLKKEYVRQEVLKGKRIDGRKLDEIRPLSGEVGVLPRTHGSAIFARGQTQVLTVATLGAPSMEQLIESAEGEESKRYIHHYSMPPYSIGEVGKVGSPSRREIGHGALAEKALEPVIPSAEVFPYTIRMVSEVTGSNGSTSQASVCGSTLSLMDAGVPITAPVAGIAMGVILESDEKYAIMTDIIGQEDFNGDMDFKVAGSEKGITAMQLDVKTLSLTPNILGEALGKAKDARLAILKFMKSVIAEPRNKVSDYAPKIKVIKIDPAKIGEVIGPGGKIIRKIIADSGAQVEVEDDGSINISGMTPESVVKATEIIEGLTKEVKPGEIYDGEVKRIQPFGAFVEVLPGKDGLVHISDMGEGFVKNPEDVVKIGDHVKVRVKEVDNLGRINLSMRMDPASDKPREERPQRRFDRPMRGPRRDFRGDRRGASGGPHFPTSRLLQEKKNYR